MSELLKVKVRVGRPTHDEVEAALMCLRDEDARTYEECLLIVQAEKVLETGVPPGGK